MFHRNHTSKHVNIQVITLSAGLALATAALISGGEILKGKDSAPAASPVASRVERIEPQFGSAADATAASIRLAYLESSSQPAVSSAAREVRDQSLGLGQPGEGVEEMQPLFGTMADADYASH